MQVSVTKKFKFEAAHHIPNYDGACRNLHGHSYKLEVEVEGEIDEETGMVMDFADLKLIVKQDVVDKFDHSNLNDHFDMPTAEVMVHSIFSILSTSIDVIGVREVKRIRLYETSNSYAEATC